MNRYIHEVPIGIGDAHFGEWRSFGSLSYPLFRRVFLHALESFIHVVHLNAEVIEPAAALLFVIVQDCKLEVPIRQVNRLFSRMSGVASAMERFKSKNVDVEVRKLLWVFCQ